MRYIWLAIIVVTAIPIGYVAVLASPWTYFTLGAEAWRERVFRLYPYRWWVSFSMLVCGFAVAVYLDRWA